jgi:hypothetical protein
MRRRAWGWRAPSRDGAGGQARGGREQAPCGRERRAPQGHALSPAGELGEAGTGAGKLRVGGNGELPRGMPCSGRRAPSRSGAGGRARGGRRQDQPGRERRAPQGHALSPAGRGDVGQPHTEYLQINPKVGYV